MREFPKSSPGLGKRVQSCGRAKGLRDPGAQHKYSTSIFPPHPTTRSPGRTKLLAISRVELKYFPFGSYLAISSWHREAVVHEGPDAG